MTGSGTGRVLSTYEVFQKHLNLGEKILWVGQPNPKIHFTSYDAILIPFSLLFSAVMIFVFVMSWSIMQDDSRIFSLIFMAFFIVSGLHFVFGRFYTKAWKKKRTYYAVTNERVLSLYRGWKQNFKELTISQIDQICKDVRTDGNGNISFGKPNLGLFSAWNNIFLNSGLYGVETASQQLHFFDIDNADEVYKIIQEMKQS